MIHTKHDFSEKNLPILMILTVLAISWAPLVEIVPLFFLKETNTPIEGLKPLTALELEGRDIYIREGCNTCHSQMIRPFRAETLRYGHYSVAGEFIYDHPFLWGSKRTGPDLARVGVSTAMNGTKPIFITRAMLCLNPICPHFPGCSKIPLMAVIPR